MYFWKLLKNKRWLIFFLLLVVHIFFRFYQLEERHQFTWDQVDNAWVAKNLIIDGKFPLLGMPAKQNTGFNIGPSYYYVVSFFYWIFDLDPIASAVFAGITSIISFIVLFYIVKKLFSFNVGLIAVFIYSVSSYVIIQDRIQWPVGFIGAISLGIFYFLYKILLGNTKYLIFLALLLGFSFHIHFTSIFYIVIILLTLPFFPRKKEIIKYSIMSLPLFLIWFAPHVITEISEKSHQSKNFSEYIKLNYHGIHLTRVLQVAQDAFIEFEPLLFQGLKPLKFILLPLFFLVYLSKNKLREHFIFSYLLLLWFLVPWFVFSIYKGQISNYYFSLTLPFAIIILSYLFMQCIQLQSYFAKIIVALCFFLYFFTNSKYFFQSQMLGLAHYKEKISLEVKNGVQNQFLYGAPESYLHYFYRRKFSSQK